MFVSAADIDKVDIFKQIDEFALKVLMRNTRVRQFEENNVILHQGKPSTVCYFVLDGIVHIRTTATGTQKGVRKAVERHQAFRSVGDSLGVTATLAHYAQDMRARSQFLDVVDMLRDSYERLMSAGANTSDAVAMVPCRLLECDADTLLTAIQISPLLVSRIARAVSLRMQQDTLLRERAAAISTGCLPVVAQFYFEWHLALTAYRERGSGKTYRGRTWTQTELRDLLEVSNVKDISSAWKFLTLDESAYRVLVEQGVCTPGATAADRKQYAAIRVENGELIINEKALLDWCSNENSQILIGKERGIEENKTQEGSHPRPKKRRAGDKNI